VPAAGDPEQPDPARIGAPADFGRELTLARQRAGLTVREVARAVGIPASTAGDYFAGRHLPPPSQPGLLPKILRACGETDPPRLSQWMSALNRIRRGPGRRPAAAPAPYRGLASFQPEDAAWFFGREELTARLVTLAAAAPAPTGASTKIGIINVEEAIVSSNEGQRDFAAMMSKYKAPNDQLQAMSKELEDKRSQLKNGSTVLSDEKRAELAGSIQDLEKNAHELMKG